MENLEISNVLEKQDNPSIKFGETKLIVGQLKTETKKPDKKSDRFSGESIDMSQILYLQDYNANPSLIYLKHQIGTVENSQPDKNILTVTSLHDSGCAKSIAKRSLIQRLEQYTGEKITIVPDKTYKWIETATKERQRIEGTADILLHFKGINGCTKSFKLNVIVHDEICHEFLLGRDFTGSDAKAFETNEHMYLTYDFDCFSDPVRTSLKNHRLCQVPFTTVVKKPIQLSNNKRIVIPPLSPANILCHITQRKGNGYKPTTKGAIEYEVTAITQPRLSTVQAVQSFYHPGAIVITVFNDTHIEYVIEPNTEIAQIELWDSSVECHRIQVCEEDIADQYLHAEKHHEMYMKDEKTLYVSNAKVTKKASLDTKVHRPAFIEDDEAMNEEEKELAFMEYMRHGYHHPSMTKVIEDHAALTQLYLKNTVPITEKEFPTLFDLKHLPEVKQQEALKMFIENRQAFSNHACDLGKSNLVEMEIELTSDKPQIQAYRPIPHTVRAQVKAILDQMIEYEIIRECDEPSPVVSNLLITKKKDGKNIRILLDGRLLNSITKRLPTNLVTHQELCAHLQGRTHVTTIDLSDAFFQIPLAISAQPLTAFYSASHGKRYCFQRCPQGLKNSPLHLKLMMDKMFGDMANDVIHYADDIMIATNGNFATHLKAVNKVLQRIVTGNIKIRPQKINLNRESIEFLGMIWTKGQLSIPEAKLLAFKNLPSPNTPKKAKSVICALAYYRKFVPKFAQLSQPIMDLSTLHPKEFKWTAAHESLFRKLIKQIITHATVYLPDPTKPYYVQTDASSYCGAGKLYQKDKDGNERLIACVSRTFTKTERAYSTIKKEVLALLYTLRTMDFFIRFSNDLKILTDAQGILFLSMCKDSQGILMRFSLELSKYDAEVIHVPGENNEVADVLSRHHVGIDQIQDAEGKITPMTEKQACEILKRMTLPSDLRFTKEEVATMLDVPSLPNPIKKPARKSTAKTGTRIIKNTPKMLADRKIKMPQTSMRRPGVILPTNSCEVIRTEELTFAERKRLKNRTAKVTQIRAIEEDLISYTDFKSISRAILTGVLTPQEFKQAQQQDPFCSNVIENINSKRRFTLIDGLLFAKYGHTIKLVLPAALLDLVINAKHYSVFGLHFSRTRMQRDIEARYYVPRKVLNSKLRLLRENCLVCQFNTTNKQDHEFRGGDYIHAPRVTWGVDLIPNLPNSENGYKAALLAVDLFTGYVQLCPLKDRSTKSLINAIERTIINAFGTPKYIRTDEEPGMFRSQEFYDYLKPLGTKFLPTSVGAPWANSNAERSIKTIKDAARNFLLQEKVDTEWDKYAHFFTAAHNSSTGVYGFAPEELMFAYKKPNAHDLLQFWPGAHSHAEYMEQIVPMAEENRQKALERGDKRREKNRSYKNVHRVIKQFQLGQIVAHRQLQLATGAAMGMKPKHTGPYIIVALHPDGCSATIEHLHTGHLMNAHFTHLQVISFHAGVGNRVDANFDDRLLDMLSKKSTLLTKTVTELDISEEENTPPITTLSMSQPDEQMDETEIDNSDSDMSETENESVNQTQSIKALTRKNTLKNKVTNAKISIKPQIEVSFSATTTIEEENDQLVRELFPHLNQSQELSDIEPLSVEQSVNDPSDVDTSFAQPHTSAESQNDATELDSDTDHSNNSMAQIEKESNEVNSMAPQIDHLPTNEKPFEENETTFESNQSITNSEIFRNEAIKILNWLNDNKLKLSDNDNNDSTSTFHKSSLNSFLDHESDNSLSSNMEKDEGTDSSFNPPIDRTSTPIKKCYTKRRKKRDSSNYSTESDSDSQTKRTSSK